MKRRAFLQRTFLSTLGATTLNAAGTRAPRILLRSSWQTVNIGDVAHSPGVLTLLERHLHEAEVRLWPGDVKDGVREMLQARFPALQFVETREQVAQSFSECDFLLHGSGPSLVAANHVEQWSKSTGKPYGIYGITLAAIDQRTKEILDKSAFTFFRDSVSLALAKSHGVQAPVMEFAPDGAFAVDLRNQKRADAFLSEHGLEHGRFLCCIPRARRTPYWLIERKHRPVDPVAQALNARMLEHDHAPHREAIIKIVRETNMKILICPEDETQMAIGREALYEPLPEDVKKRVVWRDSFWLTDEALSVYVRSAGLFGNEMHSPIMCIGNGIPAIVCRWSEQTSKGFMWRDIGLSEWLFDFDSEPDLVRLPETVLAMAKNPGVAADKVRAAQTIVKERQTASMQVLRRSLPSV